MKFRTITIMSLRKAGAKVSFTKEGVRFDGVTATERKSKKKDAKE